MSDDDYAWGEPSADGIALGLHVIDAAAGAYRIAIANRSAEPRTVVLFARGDDKIRTRIIARQAGTEEVAAAFAAKADERVVIELPPGQVAERDGVPPSFTLTGDVTLQLVLGGVAEKPDLLLSGEVSARR